MNLEEIYSGRKRDLVPYGWDLTTLSELSTLRISNGAFNDPKQVGAGYKLINVSDLYRGNEICPSGLSRLSLSEKEYETFRVKFGDIFFTRSSLKKEGIAHANIFLSDEAEVVYECHMMRVRPNPQCVSPKYLLEYCLARPARDYFVSHGKTTTMTTIDQGSIGALPVLLPPLAEQRKIAAILTAVDDKLEVIARQITATQALKQGLMQTLFTKGVGTQDAEGRWAPHSDFKSTVLGDIPVRWAIGTIGDFVAELSSGVSVNGEDRVHEDAEIGVLKVSSVFGGKFHPREYKAVLPVEVERVAEPVQAGCIIVSRANTPSLVGESAYVEIDHPDLFLPDKLWQTKPSQFAHCVRWLSFFLQSSFVRQEIGKAATGTSGSMKNISKAAFLGIPMPIIPIDEQRRVTDVLVSLSDKQDILLAKHQHFQTLKRGLMQKLLTGEWRVKVDNAQTIPSVEAA